MRLFAFVTFTATALFMVPPAAGQVANKPPVPMWLQVSDGGGAGPVAVSASFDQKSELLKAILLVATEGPAVVRLNDREVAQVAGKPGQVASSIDVTRAVQQGANSISLEVSPGARFAALLELNGDLARKQWLATDATWKARSGRFLAMNAVDAEAATNPFDLKKTFDAYNSWQLARPGAQNHATDPATFTLPPGFKAELIRSAQAEDGSWVAMAFDPQGRVTLAREKKGLLRFAPEQQDLQVIEDTLLECRGLLYAHGVLYANANNNKGLYRLRDLNGDGVFEEKTELIHSEGGVGHGRNHIKLGPDGRVWVAHGNNVLLPSPISQKSPLRHYGHDQTLPNPWDGSMFDGSVELPAGHILAYDPKDGSIELIAGGLRNPLDIAFNRHGELFTFDADMERDVGASWYMPNRVLHVVSGADFGWRRGTGRYPARFVDTLPSVVDIGLASPTGIFFGYGAKFPKKYQEALFISDWSYGRLLAVHLREEGASYVGTTETLITGRPLNLTDGCIGPDGALWFITGGRGTQSGLYRVTYTQTLDPVAESPQEIPPHRLHALRKKLETLHHAASTEETEIDFVWASMEHQDRHIRWAARLALENLPVERWQERMQQEDKAWPILLSVLATTRRGDRASSAVALERLGTLDWPALSEEQQLALIRIYGVVLARSNPLTAEERSTLLYRLEPLYPANGRQALNHDLCQLLVRLKSPQVLAKSLPIVADATASEDLIFYPLHLRYLKDGWDLAARRVVFEALNRAEKLNGASTYFKAIQDTRAELAADLPPDQALALASLIHPPKQVALSPHALPGHTFKVWQLEDLLPRLEQVSKGRSFEKGRAAVISTQCVFCHRVSNDATLPAGVFGPELIQASARFNRRDLLDHILNPSKVTDDKFRFITITRMDGTTVTGSLETEDDERVILRPNPLAPDTVEIGKSIIKARTVSDTSPMPTGLLNSLKAEQILDLLAFIESGGNAQHPCFAE